jgi:hypothetical protein
VTRPKAVQPFQVPSVDRYMILQLGPRTARPGNSRELVLQVFHRTTGGGVSVLIEPDQVGILARWFTSTEAVTHSSGGHPPLGPQPDGSFQEPTLYYRQFIVLPSFWTLRDLQTTAETEMLDNGGCRVSVFWNGSGRTRSATLSAEDRRAVAGFLTKFDRDGWATDGITYEDGK